MPAAALASRVTPSTPFASRQGTMTGLPLLIATVTQAALACSQACETPKVQVNANEP
jgi:hypothetical protein